MPGRPLLHSVLDITTTNPLPRNMITFIGLVDTHDVSAELSGDCRALAAGREPGSPPALVR